jgi:hypothetical protein
LQPVPPWKMQCHDRAFQKFMVGNKLRAPCKPLARPNGMKPNKTKDFDLRQA